VPNVRLQPRRLRTRGGAVACKRLLARAGTNLDPVSPFRYRYIWSPDDVLQQAAVLFYRSDLTHIVVVACYQYTANAELVVGDLKRPTKNGSRIALSTELWNHDIADVPTNA
jgi:hypothetical protein